MRIKTGTQMKAVSISAIIIIFDIYYKWKALWLGGQLLEQDCLGSNLGSGTNWATLGTSPFLCLPENGDDSNAYLIGLF